MFLLLRHHVFQGNQVVFQMLPIIVSNVGQVDSKMDWEE